LGIEIKLLKFANNMDHFSVQERQFSQIEICTVYLLWNNMKNLKAVSTLLRSHQADLHQRGVKSLAVFGSLARGEATPSSDIDVLVEFDHPVGLFEFIRLKLYLEELTGSQVDLVTPDALRPAMRSEILSEAVHVA
jgi:uncharacterized protein